MKVLIDWICDVRFQVLMAIAIVIGSAQFADAAHRGKRGSCASGSCAAPAAAAPAACSSSRGKIVHRERVVHRERGRLLGGRRGGCR